MANRYVPFGYEILDAKIVIVEREAEVIKSVYSLYVQGNSLKNIAERLNMLPITYAGDGREWDKHMVKRMLENKKYIGFKDYPVIIPPETAELALKCKEKKCSEMNKDDKLKLDAYRQRIKCDVCDSKMQRKHAGSGTRRRIYWQCTNPECTARHRMFKEKILDEMVTGLMNEISEDLTVMEFTEEKDYEKDAEIIRLTNEVHEMMEDSGAEPQSVIDKIMNLASTKFKLCKVGDNSEITKRIKTEFAIYPKKDNVDGEMVQKVIKEIKLHPDKVIRVQLINGKEFERTQ